ncbi:CapA family protein [Georgenia yuyongxinii]|uniref:CapA family protein n=1 Tax=Georgenia yuyongxinii TaxID=2589797 RepID=A0A5B8C130_9MICO|nr:CapA family protein [Georgenia yuyongxinii]QDC24293.1 CapA family protein [Georgenia yuyongxinii]
MGSGARHSTPSGRHLRRGVLACCAAAALAAACAAPQSSGGPGPAAPTSAATSSAGSGATNRSPSVPPSDDAASPPVPEPPTGSAPGDGRAATFTIVSAGDVLPHASVNRAAQRPDGSYDFVPLMAGLEPWTAGGDLALCSLEVPLAPPGEEVTAYPAFGAPDELVAALADLGWDGCATATNHALDRGLPGLRHTVDVLAAAGLGYVGTARTPAEAAAPQRYVLERAGRRLVVAHLSTTLVLNGPPLPAESAWSLGTNVAVLVAQARLARQTGADLVVVSMHWGTEYLGAPDATQREAAATLAASGQIDLVLGSHPHVPQPIEHLPGGPDGTGTWVVWSMGNFISNQDSVCCVPETATGLVVTATVLAPSGFPARVTAVDWTAVTVDRAGGQRIYPLHALSTAPAPGVTLDAATLADRSARVQQVMGSPERTVPPTSTGAAPEVQPRRGE